MAEQSQDNQEPKSPAKPSPASGASAAPAGADARTRAALRLLGEIHPPRRTHVLRWLLVVNALLVVATAFVLLNLWHRQKPAQQEAAVTEIDGHRTRRSTSASAPATMPAALEPVSWRTAQKTFARGDYASALKQYQLVLASSRRLAAEGVVLDYLQFRVAQCLLQTNQAKSARELYHECSQSASPIVRAAASYQLAALELLDGRPLPARVQAYTAIAALGCLTEAHPLEAECDFLIARALTEKASVLSNAPAIVSWRAIEQADPFTGLDERQLRELLHKGTQSDAEAALGPQLERTRTDGGRLYQVHSAQAPLEELLSRFASDTSLELKWQGVAPVQRQRAVSVSFVAVNEQRLAEVAAGLAALVGRFTGEGIEVQDVDSISSLSVQRAAIAQEASACWRRFALRHGDDKRLPQVRFALGFLNEMLGEPLEAMREYQLVARQYRRDPVAPKALLRSAILRIRMKDFAAARNELQELLDGYGDYRDMDQVHLALGDATLESGLAAQAAEVYGKLYYMDVSPDSKSAAALGAGRAFAKLKNHQQAARWLGRYIALGKASSPQDAVDARLMLGRSLLAIDKLSGAAAAFEEAVAIDAGKELHVASLLELADVQLKRQRYGSAISALKKLENEDLAPRQQLRLSLAAIVAYRSMGLSDRAITYARRKIKSAQADHAAALKVELARCHADEGELSTAHALLAEAMLADPAGMDQTQLTVELAGLCMQVGKSDQATGYLRQALKNQMSDELRRQAIQMLGQAYAQQKQYAQAAAAYAMLSSDKTEKK